MTLGDGIKDRVKELRKIKASELIPHPQNWRRHPETQSAALTGVLSEIGFADAVIARETPDGLQLIDGHLRQDLMGDQEIPVLVVDLTEDEAKKMLVTFDPLSAMADTNADILRSLLASTNFENDAILAMLQTIAPISPVAPREDPGPQIDRADELREKWQTERGQVWEVGRHRLMCGDNRDELFHLPGDSVLMCDPPYNVDKDYGAYSDDALIEADYEAFTRAWFEPWRAVTIRQIISPGCYNLGRWCRYFDPYHVAPWTKTNSMTNGKVARWWCWEPILFYGSNFGRTRPNDVFNYPIGQQKDVANHPCPKPLALWADLIANYTVADGIVVDPFLGSGTTMVAAEQLGRICYGMEIEPKYVAVTLERMSGMGLEPKVVADIKSIGDSDDIG